MRSAPEPSRADIVDTAITIADAEGTDAVSMRRIAREMRAGAMSLYWHVSSNEALHQLMLQKLQAEGEAPVPSGDWRADLRTYAGNARAALLPGCPKPRWRDCSASSNGGSGSPNAIRK